MIATGDATSRFETFGSAIFFLDASVFALGVFSFFATGFFGAASFFAATFAGFDTFVVFATGEVFGVDFFAVFVVILTSFLTAFVAGGVFLTAFFSTT